jgi:CubicO group peptidase (beta-lactamase class C family)
MHSTISTGLSVVNQRSATTKLVTSTLRLAASLVVGFWLSACDHNRDTDAVPTHTTAEVKLAQRIDSIYTASMQTGTAPGMSVVAIKGGKILFQKGYGYADVQAKTPVTNDTRFAIGSTTKAMTAYGVLRLVDKGLVRLNAKVTTYIPEFVMKDMRYKDITVSQLLSHSSGIKSFTEIKPPIETPDALEGILAILAKEDLEFAPGRGFYYSNYGATLAGLLIQRVAKMPYEDYMQRELFDKVGMPNTTMKYWLPNALAGTKGYAVNAQNQLVETRGAFDRLYLPAGAGTITNSTDVARYLTAFVSGTTTPSGEKLLSDSLATRMFRGSVNANEDDFIKYLGATATYSLGWYNINRNGYVTIEHGGNNGAMLSYFFIDPKTKSAVAILVNQEDISKLDPVTQVARLVFTAQ